MNTHRLSVTTALLIGAVLASGAMAAEKSPTLNETQDSSPGAASNSLNRNISTPSQRPLPTGVGAVPGNANLPDRATVNNLENARTAREMQNLQKLHDAQRALQPGFQKNQPDRGLGMNGMDGNSLRERAATFQSSPSTGAVNFGDGPSGQRTPNGPINRNTGLGDYRTGMQSNAAAKRPGMFSGQPVAGSSVPDRRSFVAEDGAPKVSTREPVKDPVTGDVTSGTTRDSPDGTIEQVSHTDHPDGTSDTVYKTKNPDGTATIVREHTFGDGTNKKTIEQYDAQGNRTSSGQFPSSDPFPRPALPRPVVPARSYYPEPAGQPDEGHTSGSRNTDCNWNPVWGRCTNQTKPSKQDMTAQPARGGGASGSSAGGARPQIGAAAVTNSGDSSFSSSRPGNNVGNGPIDMRDPSAPDPTRGGPARSGGFVP